MAIEPKLKTVALVQTDFGVGLGFTDKKRGKPYFVDFLTISWRQRLQKSLPKNHIFTRALGVYSVEGGPGKCRVLDITAGFGQDAVVALSLGCEVTAIERSSEVFAVLKDGVDRAIREEESLRPIFARLKLVHADAADYLQKLNAAERPHVIYLDTMFDKPKKSAKSPKQMQLLQDLLGDSFNAGEQERLLDLSLQQALDRVVVKQPLKGRALKASPSHSFKGQSIRYDVYTKP